ncbi:MAG: crossover junction endodeoxyribonuclease RuvC [Clostridia bacterium]|nr:crossover junction endodeoxyribonuclease RuvC [Clostridia bacterium]
MLIMGVDPGTAITGYGIINMMGNKFQVITYDCIRTQAEFPLDQRLRKIYQEIKFLIGEYRPEHFAIEELFFNKNTRTALAVGHARGVAMLAAAETNIPVYEYTPLQVKQAVVGYGRAEKSQVQSMVKTLLGLDKVPKPDDVADALALAICHAHSYKINMFKDMKHI